MDSELSYEMLMEIISRASLTTLDTMRCMNKELDTLTYESYLLDAYKKRNQIVSGFLIQDTKSDWNNIREFAPSPDSKCPDLGFLPPNAQVLATSEQGIMVYQTPDYKDVLIKHVYHVCKLATQQVFKLPNPKVRYPVHKVAIVVKGLKPLRYKIIRFFGQCALKRKRESYTTYRCDIFDSMMWEWRSLNRVKLADGVFLTEPQPVTKSGSIYMLLTNNDILKFDAYSEKWEVLPSPIPYDQSGTSMELVKYGGKLGLACKPPNSDGCCEIWVLTVDGVWEKEGVVAAAESESERELKALYDLDTSVVVDRNTLMFYKFKNQGDNMIGKVELNGIHGDQIFSFRSDFEAIDLI